MYSRDESNLPFCRYDIDAETTKKTYANPQPPESRKGAYAIDENNIAIKICGEEESRHERRGEMGVEATNSIFEALLTNNIK